MQFIRLLWKVIFNFLPCRFTNARRRIVPRLRSQRIPPPSGAHESPVIAVDSKRAALSVSSCSSSDTRHSVCRRSPSREDEDQCPESQRVCRGRSESPSVAESLSSERELRSPAGQPPPLIPLESISAPRLQLSIPGRPANQNV